MRVVVQRVKSAKCIVNSEITGIIDNGLLIFVGFGLNEDEYKLKAMAQKIAHARVFEDAEGKMNLDVIETQGKVLSISQFTLYGDTRKGNRPSFDQAAKALDAAAYYKRFNTYLAEWIPVETGLFQAHMEIESINDGPVTLLYEN